MARYCAGRGGVEWSPTAVASLMITASSGYCAGRGGVLWPATAVASLMITAVVVAIVPAGVGYCGQPDTPGYCNRRLVQPKHYLACPEFTRRE